MSTRETPQQQPTRRSDHEQIWAQYVAEHYASLLDELYRSQFDDVRPGWEEFLATTQNPQPR